MGTIKPQVACGEAGPEPQVPEEVAVPRAPSRRDPAMKRLLAATCLVFLLLAEAGAAPVPQVLIKTKGKKGVPEQDTEKAWGARAVDPPEKDGQLLPLLPVLGLKPIAAAKEELPGASTQADAKDILSRFRNPRRGPEPDLDQLYHPQPVGQGRAGPRPWILPRRQVLQGSEVDRDHIYHRV